MDFRVGHLEIYVIDNLKNLCRAPIARPYKYRKRYMSKLNFQHCELTDEQKQIYAHSFESIDTDNDGYLTEEEFRLFMGKNGWDTCFVEAIFKVFDTNKDRKLTFNEFIEYIYASNRSCTDPTYFFKLIFDALDEDHSNSLSINEILEFMRLVGMPMTHEEAVKEMGQIDADANGGIDFSELCRILGLV